MAKTALIFSGYWFSNWIRVCLWQNSNEVKGQTMIQDWLDPFPIPMSEAHSFNQDRWRVYSRPGSGRCCPCPHVTFLMSVMGWAGRKDSMSFGIYSSLFSHLPQRGRASANDWQKGNGRWPKRVTKVFCVPLKSRWRLGDSLHFMGSIGPGSGHCGCPKGPEHDCRISFPVGF